MIKLKELIEGKYRNNEVTAYHGTPHKIEGNFKVEKVGSGEGAASFGWGLYFAENPKVAQSYKDSLARYTISGEDLHIYYHKQNFPRNAMQIAHEKHITYDKAVEEYEKILPLKIALDFLSTYNINAEHMLQYYMNTSHSSDQQEQYKSALEMIERLKKEGILKKDSNIYTVDIDVNLKTLLDWFMTIDEQDNDIKVKIKKITEDIGKVGSFDSILNITGEDFYRRLMDILKTKKNASLYLDKYGIKGIKYLDNGSRDVKGSGTYNYVIFDEKLIKIRDENGTPISIDNAEKEDATLRSI